MGQTIVLTIEKYLATIVTSFLLKKYTLVIATFITQCCLLFQHVKIIQKIHHESAVFLKSKTIWNHLHHANVQETYEQQTG